jgi:hypothetical protein
MFKSRFFDVGKTITVPSANGSARIDQLERRSYVRTICKLPITLRFDDIYEEIGEAANMSARGIFVVLPTKVISGSPVELIFRLPQNIVRADGIWLRCQAEVTRAKYLHERQFGVAAMILDYEVLRAR